MPLPFALSNSDHTCILLLITNTAGIHSVHVKRVSLIRKHYTPHQNDSATLMDTISGDRQPPSLLQQTNKQETRAPHPASPTSKSLARHRSASRRGYAPSMSRTEYRSRLKGSSGKWGCATSGRLYAGLRGSTSRPVCSSTARLEVPSMSAMKVACGRWPLCQLCSTLGLAPSMSPG